MTAGKEHVKKMKHRKSYRNVWHTDLMSTIAADTPYCCFALFCGPCASYKLRKQALYGDMSRYRCCGGYMPYSGKCGERKCPQFCLCTEVFFCFGNSVASTRFMLQDELNIQTTKCDNCIIGCMACLQQVACIFSILACLTGSDELNDASQLLNCLADLVFCSVCTCLQTQHKIEMDKRDGKYGMRPMEIPYVQEMSRYDQAAYPSPPVQYGPPPYGTRLQPILHNIKATHHNKVTRHNKATHHNKVMGHNKATHQCMAHHNKATHQCMARHNQDTRLQPIHHHIKATRLQPILLSLLHRLHRLMYKATHHQVNISSLS
ncbi:uncharacterized protein LOC143550958 [Bidens hawaiensis]|uniref:uncharacterized protein LOC143550958 n=1 Tax=Bidens hawaiensis TaxID=980011 RepID=UPI00404B94C4